MSNATRPDNGTGGDGGPQMRDGVYYAERKPFVLEFFAYETVGITPAHVGSVVKTDDPELMKALGDAIEQGRVVMDGDTIVSIDGKPLPDTTLFDRPEVRDIGTGAYLREIREEFAGADNCLFREADLRAAIERGKALLRGRQQCLPFRGSVVAQAEQLEQALLAAKHTVLPAEPTFTEVMRQMREEAEYQAQLQQQMTEEMEQAGWVVSGEQKEAADALARDVSAAISEGMPDLLPADVTVHAVKSTFDEDEDRPITVDAKTGMVLRDDVK